MPSIDLSSQYQRSQGLPGIESAYFDYRAAKMEFPPTLSDDAVPEVHNICCVGAGYVGESLLVSFDVFPETTGPMTLFLPKF